MIQHQRPKILLEILIHLHKNFMKNLLYLSREFVFLFFNIQIWF